VKILVALDGMDFEKAFAMYVQLAPHCDGFKINHTLLEHSSMFANYEGEVMVDLKLWDTPNSVCSIVEKILKTPATMCTVSTLNNEEVFKELHQYSEDIKLLGVTYLTSWSSTEQFYIF
jgi:orotidine-5'-phosphate decarboxylase